MTKTIAKSKSANTKNPNAVASINARLSIFPVVGFGASAGGLEAFTSVLNHLDNSLGMAYMLVMHLPQSIKVHLGKYFKAKRK